MAEGENNEELIKALGSFREEVLDTFVSQEQLISDLIKMNLEMRRRMTEMQRDLDDMTQLNGTILDEKFQRLVSGGYG